MFLAGQHASCVEMFRGSAYALSGFRFCIDYQAYPFAGGKARVAIVRLCARYVLYVVAYCEAGVAVAQMWRIMAQYISL